MPIAADIYYHAYQETEEGQKLPVVLIHGAGGNYLFWPSQVRRMPGFRVLALDLPGHGKSTGCGQQSIGAYAQSVMDWLEAVGVRRVVLVGHSMGSAIAMRIALDHPKNVVGLGLIGAAARLRVATSLLESAASPTTFHLAVETVVANSFAAQTPTSLTELACKRMLEVRPSVLYGDFLACDAFDEINRISQINKPTLILSGSEDKMTPPRYAQFLADAIPDSRLEMIPNAGHMVMLEQPQAVASILADFLRRILFA